MGVWQSSRTIQYRSRGFSHERTLFLDDESDDGGNHRGQAIVRSPAVRVDRAISQNLTFNDGPQRVTRAVIDNFDVHTTPSFQQTYDRNLATSATSTFAAYSPRSEIAFSISTSPVKGLL